LLADEGFDQPQPKHEAEPTQITRDATDALVALGYSRTEAERLVAQVDEESAPETVEDAIRAVFRKLNPA
jgi:Holliday junction resolvasome RuvABC DNA-binding subunit